MSTNNTNSTNKSKTGKTSLIYPELSYQIMQVLFEVHNQLRPGFPEEVYERAAVIEFRTRGIPVDKQKTIQVVYKGNLVGTYRLDLVVDGKIILELKAIAALNDVFKQQLLSYLKATGLKLGNLVNFGASRVRQDCQLKLLFAPFVNSCYS